MMNARRRTRCYIAYTERRVTNGDGKKYDLYIIIILSAPP